MNSMEMITGERLFDDLRQAVKTANGSTATAYRQLRRIFIRCIDERTNRPGLRFGGTFAKTEYLLKHHKADTALTISVNTARIRMRQNVTVHTAVLHSDFMHDMKAVCQFIALVYSIDTPSDLTAIFPPDEKKEAKHLLSEYMRVMVKTVDDTYIYATADSATASELKIHYYGRNENAAYADWDWAYLKDMVTEGTQLNIIRPREADGVLYPELIIVEPDYLVDISSVAACFETYSHSPLIHLLNRLKPAASSSAMLLGNLAGQLLDETLRLQPDDRPYRDSVSDFFRSNALTLATTDMAQDFHQEAQRQKQNIRRALMETLPAALQGNGIDKFDSTEIMVEPSFFSEMLGLQGRMDFLQMDERVLIEQKSGKGGWPQSEPDTPRPQEKHYVQLLLYMLLLRYNNREQYERNRRSLFCYLFYSKYANGLISMAYAPQLVFEAVKVRNGIAAAEFGYTRDGLSVLNTLTADAINDLHSAGRLWEAYQKPELNAILQPIHDATELERTYFLRMLRFVATEHLMAKIGNQTKENSGFADKWYSTLDDKLLAGNIYCDLRLLSPAADDHGNVERVTLGFDERPDNDISNFRPGDIVVLYPYDEGQEPDVRRTMAFRSTIEKITDDTITLLLRSTQAGGGVFWRKGERKWAIEHDFFESSFTSLYRALHAFLRAPQERRDLLLCQREPQTDSHLTLKGDYGAFNPLALRVRQAKELFLIIGPPGTGKTSYGMLNTVREELMHEASSVLLMSYTNRAVDEICGKLADEGIDFIRLGNRLACEERFRPYLLEEKSADCSNIRELRQLLTEARVIVGTTTSLNAASAIFRLRSFSLAIIDEASQILEPHLVGLLSATDDKGDCAIRKIVMIGDHKQLPAVVQQREEDSRVNDQLLQSIGLTDCRLSLFERLLRRYSDRPDCVYMLTRQGRMHHDIALYPSRAFYDGRLQEVPLPHQTETLNADIPCSNGIEKLIATRRTAFVDVESPENSPSDKVNRCEAEAITATIVSIYRKEKEHFSPLTTVGVIVPYRNQIAEIRKHLELTGIETLRNITIDTVERYQGSQRDYILYGFTVQRYYQLDFLTANVFEEQGHLIDRKLNVAMTRARCHLFIFGNAKLLCQTPVFSTLIKYMRTEETYISIPVADYVKGNFSLPV